MIEREHAASGDNLSSQGQWPAKRRLLLGLGLAIVALAIAGTYLFQQQKINARQSEIDALNQKITGFYALPNQACLGLATVPEIMPFAIGKLDATRTLAENSSDGLQATFTCTIGQNAKDAAGSGVAAVDSNGREMGAEVLYFASADTANAYHEGVINPQRYWSVPNKPLTDKVPSLKYFTSYIFGSPVYFDAYAVRENVIVRVTLPCGTMSDRTAVTCRGSSVDNGAAVSSLKHFVESVADIDFSAGRNL